jgi:LysM repeat protein
VAHIPFVNDTVIVFVVDMPDVTVSVTVEQMVRWGVDTDDLERLARENLARYQPDLKVKLVESETGGRAAILSVLDGYDAARLALNADLRIPPIEVLRPGAKPAAGTAVADATKPEAKTTAVASASYTIQKGDTPYAIAKKRGIKVAELLNYNGIKDPSALKPGQTLKIPNKG